MKKPLFLLFLLFASIYAASVTAEFRQPIDPGGSIYKFDTDLSFTTDFTMSLISGSMASGDAANIQSGDKVCSGAVIRITPSVAAKWAAPDLDVVAWYPNCDLSGNCPGAMIAGGAVGTNKNVKWLSSTVFNSHKTYGDGTSYSQSRTRYDELATFYTEPMGYYNSSGTYSSKEGEANVFCKGRVDVRDGGTSKGTLTLPTSGNVNYSLTGAGSHSITTRLSDSACIAVAVKHPTEYTKVTMQDYFYMSYYAQNQPTVPEAIATKTITVQASGGTVDFEVTSATASGTLTDEDLILVDATVHNSGDPIQITSVTNTNSGSFSAAPFDDSLCALLGISPCPSPNGFNSTINTGSNKHLYVLITRLPGASGGTVLTFHANTTSSSCGGSSTGSADLDIGDDVPFTCEITPPSLTMATNEVGQFYVACENIAGDSIPCTGTNWYWADGLAGDFILKTNSEAQAYSTSAPGSDGTLRYKSQMASCLSDIEMTSPSNGYECEFIPPSATMNVSTSKYFRLNCFDHGAAHVPDDVDYDLVDGLSGSTSNSSTAGTSYDAPGSPTSGRLRGFAQWNDHPPDILGTVAFAEIDVTNGTDGNETCPDCEGPGGEGSTKWCTIGSGPLNVYPGYSGWIGIMCGKNANETCANVTWSSSGGVSVGGGTDGGVDFTITGNPGDSCRINAYVNNTPDQNCYKPCYIGKPECWEFT